MSITTLVPYFIHDKLTRFLCRSDGGTRWLFIGYVLVWLETIVDGIRSLAQWLVMILCIVLMWHEHISFFNLWSVTCSSSWSDYLNGELELEVVVEVAVSRRNKWFVLLFCHIGIINRDWKYLLVSCLTDPFSLSWAVPVGPLMAFALSNRDYTGFSSTSSDS